VLRKLREAIVGGRVAQGEQLREVQLAQTFGSGRGVIREAIRQLVGPARERLAALAQARLPRPALAGRGIAP
jgi:DNA-binding GntR family transcriptional regulator